MYKESTDKDNKNIRYLYFTSYCLPHELDPRNKAARPNTRLNRTRGKQALAARQAAVVKRNHSKEVSTTNTRTVRSALVSKFTCSQTTDTYTRHQTFHQLLIIWMMHLILNLAMKTFKMVAVIKR